MKMILYDVVISWLKVKITVTSNNLGEGVVPVKLVLMITRHRFESGFLKLVKCTLNDSY